MATPTEPNLGLSPDSRAELAKLLNRLLADEQILLAKTKNYHWNVEALGFAELHEFFDEQAGELLALIDEVAERVRKLGHYSLGSLAEYLAHTGLKEAPGGYREAKTMLADLLADHEQLIQALRANIARADDALGDAATADDLTGWLKAHEKMAWMLRASLR